VFAWILDGCAAACRELHRRYETQVFHAILQQVDDPYDATDLTLKTFEKVYRKLAKFDPARPFAPWILRVARNTAIDHFRKEQREARARQDWLIQTSGGWRLREGIPAQEEPSDPPVDVECLKQELARATEQLNRTYLDCFRLHYQEERSYAEIAKKLHLTEATARSYAHRARKHLQRMLGSLRHYLVANTPA